MIGTGALAGELADVGLDTRLAELEPLIRARLSDAAHGDLPRWRQLVADLPAAVGTSDVFDADTVAVGGALDPAVTRAVRDALLMLAPWRKGPFEVGGIRIDAEWQSNLKWQRLEGAIAPLADRRVLDVGCGNGYYACRMRGGGAVSVLGIDPTLLYLVQFAAIRRFMQPQPITLLPLRLEELPRPLKAFDTTFSMGVLYHQRSPLAHLSQLRDTLRSGGQLVLETIYLPGSDAHARTPPGRYARMRNVWLLPTLAELQIWLERSGFRDVVVADESVTTVAEQRATEWMPFKSLADALDADDPSVTVEGWPAPRRVILTASVD